MFSLLKSAIKKDSSTKAEANGGNLDDFFKKGVGKYGLDNSATATMTNKPDGERNGGIKSIRNEFRASEYGLVIRDLDKEKEESASNQSISTEDDTAQRQAEASEQEPAVVSDPVEASGTTEDASMQARPDPDQRIGEGASADEQFLRDLDNEEQDHAESENLQDTKDAPDQHNGGSANEISPGDLHQETAQEEGDPNLFRWTPRNLDDEAAAEAGQIELMGEDNGLTQSLLNQDETEFSPDERSSNGNDDEAQNPGQQAVEDEQAAFEKGDFMVEDIDENLERDTSLHDGELEDGEWRPRDLDAEDFDNHRQLDLQDPDALQSEAGTIEDAAGDGEPIYSDQAHEFDDNQSDQYYDSRDEASLPGSVTPNRDGADEMDGLEEFSDGEGRNPDDNNSNFDDPRLEQEDDIDVDDVYPEIDQEYGEGEDLEEPNDEFDNDVGSEMTDSLQQDEEALDESDEAPDVEDGMSENDIEEQPEETDEVLDDDSTGEGFDGDVVEQKSTTSDDPLEADDGLGGDEATEGDEDLDADNDLHENDGLGIDGNVEGDESLYGEDGLEAADGQSVIADSAAEEEENSDLGSNLGSQAELEETAPDNPLSVPGKEWTEEHLAAFLIHVQSKANIFDFLTRKGVSNHERVSEVITQSLKLCLKDTSKEDTTALRSKKHATIFMEAGGTPLGPFVAFLALTVQSTMNPSKDEKNRDEKKTKVDEKVSEDEESEPASADDEDDPWDDFDLEDDLEAAPSHFEPPKLVPVAPKSGHDGNSPCKGPEVATNIMVVMFLQAVLETSRAAILEPAKAYLEWTFIPQPLLINSIHANCKDENYGSLHEKREKLTAGDHLKWEDVNPLEYVSIGTQPMYSKQHYIDSHDIKAKEAAHMIGMICERLRTSKNTLSEFDRTTFVITSSATSISFAYAVFTLEYIKYHKLEEGLPSTLTAEMEDIIIDPEDPEPELKIFESVPYDLSRWDEAHEAAELALAMVEFLQRNGPLLAAADADADAPMSPVDGLDRAKSSASSNSAFDDSGKRFPIKIRPQRPEESAPSQEEMPSDGDAEHMSDKGLSTPVPEDQEEDLEENEDHEGMGLEEDPTNEEEGLRADDIGEEEDREEEGLDDEGLDEEDYEDGLEEGALDANGMDDGVSQEGDVGYDDGDDYTGSEGQFGEDMEEEIAEEEMLQDHDLENEVEDIRAEGSTYGDEGSAYGEGGSAYGEEGSVYDEEGSVYDEADADLRSPSQAPATPYSNEGEVVGESGDQASMYDEDQYTPEQSPRLDDHSREEPAEDDYVSGEDEDEIFQDDPADGDYLSGQADGEKFQDEVSDTATQADLNEDEFARDDNHRDGGDYRSGEEYGENFDDGISDGATQAGYDDEELALKEKLEDNYLSGEDDAEIFHDDISDDATQADGESEELALEENRTGEDDYLSGEVNSANFHDDVVYEATQSEMDGEELALERNRIDEDSYSNYGEGNHSEAAEDEFQEGTDYAHGSVVDQSEDYTSQQEYRRGEDGEMEGSIQGEDSAGDVSPNGLQPDYEDQEIDESYDVDEAHQDFSDEQRDYHSDAEHADDPTMLAPAQEGMDEIPQLYYPEDERPSQAADEKSLPPLPKEHFQNIADSNHPSDRDGEADNHTSQEPAQEDAEQTLPEIAYHPNQPESTPDPSSSEHSKQPELPDQDFEFQFQTQDLDLDQGQSEDNGDHREDHHPERESDPAEGADDDQLYANQDQQQYGQPYEHQDVEAVEEEREPQYGDPMEGYLFDAETQEYYPLGEDGQPYIPQEQEHDLDEEGHEADSAEHHAEGEAHKGSVVGPYDGEGYHAEIYRGEGYDGAGYDGAGYGGYDGGDEEQEQGYQHEHEHEQLGQGVYDPASAGVGAVAGHGRAPVQGVGVANVF